MSATVPIDSLMRSLRATLEQQAAIKRILIGGGTAERAVVGTEDDIRATLLRIEKKVDEIRAAVAGRAEPEVRVSMGEDLLQHSLRCEAGCWVLCIKGKYAYPRHEIGLSYAARLLARPGEPLGSASLFAECSHGHRKAGSHAEMPDPETGLLQPITDGVAAADLTVEEEEAEARQRHYSELSRYKGIINDQTIPQSEREAAQRAYDELMTFLKEHYQRAPRSPGRAVTKLVHRAIQRLCQHLCETAPGARTPDPTAVAFADYIEQHILVPSRRYTAAKAGCNVRLARGELAGRLVFEPPPGHHWKVRF